MWTVWLTVGVAVLVVIGLLAGLLPLLRRAPSSWRLLSVSGIILGIFGIIWVLRAWEPTAAPYRVAERYPFGSHLQAWQVSFGFTWLAFGVLFFCLALLVSRGPTVVGWLTLLVSWMVCMLPHVIVALAVAWAGENTTDVVDLRERASEPKFGLIVSTALATLTFLGSSVGGFIWTGWELRVGKFRSCLPDDSLDHKREDTL